MGELVFVWALFGFPCFDTVAEYKSPFQPLFVLEWKWNNTLSQSSHQNVLLKMHRCSFNILTTKVSVDDAERAGDALWFWLMLIFQTVRFTNCFITAFLYTSQTAFRLSDLLLTGVAQIQLA